MNLENYIKTISKYHNFTYNELVEFEKKLDWKEISANTAIKWDLIILERFQSNFDWSTLSRNKSIGWREVGCLEIAENNNQLFEVLRNSEIKWNENDFKNLKSNKIYRDYYFAIQNFFLELEIDWDIKYFIEEYSSFREDNGPFIETEYDNYSGEYVDQKMYGSQSSFNHYSIRLERVFEIYYSKNSYSSKYFIIAIENLREFFQSSSYSYEYKIMWEALSKSHSTPWNSKIIDTYCGKLHWRKLLSNESIHWTTEQIDKYNLLIQDFEWENDFDEAKEINAWNGLIINPKLPISLRIIAKKYSPDWKYLYLNKGINFTLDFLNYLEDELITLISIKNNSDFKYLEKNIFGNLHKNTEIKWTEEMLYNYKSVLNWTEEVYDSLESKSISYLPNFYYTAKFINDFEDKINFRKISSFKNVEWTREIIIKFKNRWDFEILKSNPSVSWNETFDEILNSKKSINKSEEMQW
jgi:hypothetical protein